jgi:hypothetical protein
MNQKGVQRNRVDVRTKEVRETGLASKSSSGVVNAGIVLGQQRGRDLHGVSLPSMWTAPRVRVVGTQVRSCDRNVVHAIANAF